ncbi:MAB_1171c family putative transporter [Streptomyces glaucescens]|uniref:Integral membrane protein n=1 Tax=Streptomyces glaucescens TaxID=1907 RepID=A0A089Z8X4_STRGA|nr:MAB_1171c family putative transporter [Streptomyces glaucescens]AIS02236.1 Integral membrane protein [Streptomyces glaucescens]
MEHGPSDLAFYTCGCLLLLIGLVKLPAAINRRHDMLLRAAVALLVIASTVFFLGAPDSIALINEMSGVPNLAAPLTYTALTAFSGASLLLIINWRPARPEQTRRASRICIAGSCFVILAIHGLFWLGDTPVEQLTLFDGYYADTPYIREMILLYLLAQGAGTLTTSILCWRWSREVTGSLRAGLRILVPAYLLHVAYDGVKLVAVVARWTGRRWDFLIDQVAPLAAAPSALLVVTGFALPLAGPRLALTFQALRQLQELAPLWQELHAVPTPGSVRTALPWWSTPAVRLTARMTAIFDALLSLAPYYDARARDEAYRTAVGSGEPPRCARATADAAMIIDAVRRQRTERGPDENLDNTTWGTHDLVHLSKALSSPVVHRFRLSGGSVESRPA